METNSPVDADAGDPDEPAPGPPPPSASPPPLPPVRGAKAAWWAWPLILLCLLPLDWIVWRFVPKAGANRGPADAAELPAYEASEGELALLKFQGQMVVGLSAYQPEVASKSLSDLERAIAGEKAVAALALLERFVGGENNDIDEKPEGAPIAERLEGGKSSIAAATRAALREGVDEEGRAALRESLGWFAELAPGPGMSEPPEARAIRTRSTTIAAGFGLLVGLILAGIVAGAVLLVAQLRRVQTGAARNAFVPSPVHSGTLLECFALYLGCMVGGAYLGAWLGGAFSPAGYAASVLLPLLWLRWKGMGWKALRSALGLHRGRGWWREIGAGFVGYLGVLAIASIGITLTLALSLLGDALSGAGGATGDPGSPTPAAGPEIHPIVGWIYGGGTLQRLACLFLAAGFAPLFEELFFRGALHRHLRARRGFFAAALLSSLIFAALHPQGLYGIPALAAMGLGFSLLREWRDSLVAPMTAHAINNGGLVLMLWFVL